jgi:hypothetical protein
MEGGFGKLKLCFPTCFKLVSHHPVEYFSDLLLIGLDFGAFNIRRKMCIKHGNRYT